MKKTKPILFPVAALITGFLLRGFFAPSPQKPQTANTQPQNTIWTCSMHPQIQLPESGQCPICFMDLIPLEAEPGGGEREIRISPYAAKLAELETVPVERRFAAAEIRMVGKVDVDETRLYTISAWVPGRIDRLFVDYTGMPVNKGDHLAEIYSPELLNAQKELFYAIRQNPAMVDSVRERFRLWGFNAEQIDEVERRGEPTDHLTIHAPAGGIVVHRNATEGMYVETGTELLKIADLSRVWVKLDAYESDLQWLRYGQTVEFTAEAFPGEIFKGTVSFIDPVIDEMTRTAKVRVIVENADGRLKPGQFVRATARPEIGSNGQVLNPDLAGKWISPMHPEVVKDEPGSCDVCGMPLVTAESLGYVASEDDENAPLVVPAAAVLKTGKRAVVYVKLPDAEEPAYEGREITVGAKLGDVYLVKSGLKEGEQVVTRGAFKLDAELQLQARPSMMSIESEEQGAESGEFTPQTLCPVMGNPINKEVFADYGGYRIYFCCHGCDSAFLEDPEKYIGQMKSENIAIEKTEHRHAH